MALSLKIALVQTELIWQNITLNRKNLLEKLAMVASPTDLIVLPETFTTGFTMSPQQCFETMEGETIVALKNMAAQKHSAICGSLIIKENGNYYNRFIFISPEGTINHYNKRHLFTLAGEDKAFTQGTEKIIITYKNWKICPQICYDLRFPVWSRNIEGYDILVYVSNWPNKRISAWDTLLKARAIENIAYTVGVNRVGTDSNNHRYNGHSAVYNPLGGALVYSEEQTILYTTLQKEEIKQSREQLKFLDDKDDFTLNNLN